MRVRFFIDIRQSGKTQCILNDIGQVPLGEDVHVIFENSQLKTAFIRRFHQQYSGSIRPISAWVWGDLNRLRGIKWNPIHFYVDDANFLTIKPKDFLRETLVYQPISYTFVGTNHGKDTFLTKMIQLMAEESFSFI